MGVVEWSMEKWLFGARNPRNISVTGQDRATVTIDCLYKVIHEASIDDKIYDVE